MYELWIFSDKGIRRDNADSLKDALSQTEAAIAAGFPVNIIPHEKA